MAAVCVTPGCGRDLPPQDGPGRPRKKCTTCRPGSPTRQSAEERALKLVTAADVVIEKAPRGGVEASVRRKLERASRLDEPAGQAALIAAHQIDFGYEDGAKLSALMREMRLSLAVALENATEGEDELDQIRRSHGRAPGSPA